MIKNTNHFFLEKMFFMTLNYPNKIFAKTLIVFKMISVNVKWITR